MRLSRHFVIFAGAMSSIMSPTHAQLVTKQLVLNDFGACLVRQAREQSRDLLMTTLASQEERQRAGVLALAHSSCLRGRPILSMQVGAIRGAVAEAMFVENPTLLMRMGAKRATPPIRAVDADGRRFEIGYATCLANAEPAKTVELLRTTNASAEERGAFLGYGETLKSCMPEKLAYHVNITSLRNTLAAIAYLQATERTEN